MFDRLLSRWRQTDKGEVATTPFSLDLLDAEFVQNPYPTFAWLREYEPLHRTQSGLWVLTRHQDIRDAFNHPDLGNSPSAYSVLNKRRTEQYVCASVANNIIPFLDAPAHTEVRKAIAKSFLSQVKAMPVNLEDIAREVLRSLDNPARFDVIHDFGSAYAVRVMSSLLGFGKQDQQVLEQWSEALVYLFSQIPSDTMRQQIDRELSAFRDYCQSCIDQKRSNPGSDWLSAILHTAPDMTDEQIADHAMLLFADGLENIDRAIGTAVSMLLRHPEQLAKLRTQPGLANAAVDESLRYETPAQFVGRTVQQDCTLLDQPLKKNHVVLLMLASANRDPDHYSQPDQFDISREKAPQLTFGRGAHTCLGKTLAREMIAAALRVLLNEYSSLSPTQGLIWEPRIGHRWLKSLPVMAK